MEANTNQTRTYNGFAIRLQPETDLGLAILMAEDDEGHCEPVAVASTIKEAKELAESDWRARRRRLERGGDPGLCPYVYKLWARGIEGTHLLVQKMSSTQALCSRPIHRSPRLASRNECGRQAVAVKIISAEPSVKGEPSKAPYSAVTSNPASASRCSSSKRKKYRIGNDWTVRRPSKYQIISMSLTCSP